MRKPILRHRIFQGAGDMSLSNQIVERLRPIFSGENLVTHMVTLKAFLEMSF
jgi:hypothetical protein